MLTTTLPATATRTPGATWASAARAAVAPQQTTPLLPAAAPAPAPAAVAATAPTVLTVPRPRRDPRSTPGVRRGPEAVARDLSARLARASRYGMLPGQAGAAVTEQVRSGLRELVETAFPHLRASTPDWHAAVALASSLAADVLGRYAVPLACLPSTSAPGARDAVAALSHGIDALLADAGVGVVLDLDAGTASFRVQAPAGATPSCGRAALLATCVVLLHLRLTQPLVLAALVTEGGAWLPVWRAARDLWSVPA